MGEMQWPSMVGFHILLKGVHGKQMRNRKARVLRRLMSMKVVMVADGLPWVRLMMWRMNWHNEVFISEVAIVACISAIVVFFEAVDKVGLMYMVVCLPDPRCICLEFVTALKIQMACCID